MGGDSIVGLNSKSGISESADTERLVAVSGYYGCGNMGDEAVLAGIKAAVRRVAGNLIRLLAFSQDPAATRSLHGIEAVDRMRLRSIRAALAGSALLISGGGSLLQDTTSLRSLLYYLWVARMAIRMRIPVMFYAQGIGPLARPISRWLVRSTANRVSYITVRDEASATLLRSIGVSMPPIEVTADPAFALDASPDRTADAVLHPGQTGERPQRIGVALRPWGAQPELLAAEYSGLITALAERTGAEVTLVPMQRPGDERFSEAVVRSAGRDYPIIGRVCSPSNLLALIGSMDAIVAMRLHALIFAVRAAVPPFALSYDPKVENLMRGLDLAGSMAPWTGFSPEEVADRVRSLLDERVDRSADLRRRAANLENLALRNAEIALSLVIDR